MKTVFDSKIYNCFPVPDRKSYKSLCRRKTEMVTRGRVEAAFCQALVFITLTYDSKHLPDTYSKCKDLPLFSQRRTRKKVTFLSDEPSLIPSPICGKLVHNPAHKNYKWIEKDSRPLNLKGNIYRHKQIFTQQDFKNAKHKFQVSGYHKEREFGLLVPKHLSDFLQCLRNDMRTFYNDSSLRLRFIANGEYGPNTHRPHYHLVIFTNKPKYDFDGFMRTYWIYGKILQCSVVAPDEKSTKKLTAYICGHTVKSDVGNRYQNELSPTFRLSCTFDGGIGCKLLDSDAVNSLPLTDRFNFIRSLHHSLSAWDKKSPLQYKVDDDVSGKKYPYEFPRYYKDKVLNYLAKDIRQLTESNCTMIKSVISSFCEFYHLSGQFDLLDCYLNIGLCASPSDILTIFICSNLKKMPKFLADVNQISIFVKRFLGKISDDDSLARNTFKKRYENRKQEKRYQEYLSKNHFENID